VNLRRYIDRQTRNGQVWTLLQHEHCWEEWLFELEDSAQNSGAAGSHFDGTDDGHGEGVSRWPFAFLARWTWQKI
jgi:hypothetical protein